MAVNYDLQQTGPEVQRIINAVDPETERAMAAEANLQQQVDNRVSYGEQEPTEAKQEQARANIDVYSKSEVNELNTTLEGELQQEINGRVSYSEQTPTQTEQAQARNNIDVYSKNEVNQIASAFTGQNYVTVQATQSTTAADIPTLINATGEGEQTDTIYRVAFFDGSAYDVTKYSEYTWNGTAYVQLNIRSGVEDIFDISVYNTSGGQPAVYDNLAVALAGVPGDVERGGMSVKFIQRVPAKYSVVVTTSDTQPTGTSLLSASSVTSGTYEASALTDFSTLPSATGSGNAVVYYYADGTTYTVWTITMASAQGSEYVQYRLMATAWSTSPSDWQGVDAEPTPGSRNLVESGVVERFVSAKIDFSKSNNYIFALVDNNENMILGITKDGKLVCQEDLFSIALDGKVDVSEIVDNLNSQSSTVPLSAKQGAVLKAIVDGLSTKVSNIDIISNNVYLMAIVDREYNILFGIKKDGSIYAPVFPELNTLKESVLELKDEIDSFEGDENVIEIATGKLKSYGTYQSELDASPIVDDSANYNIGFKTVGKDFVKKSVNKKMVIFNHDDGNYPDLCGVRKIYNKYGFKGSFCCVFSPFSSLDAARKKIVNMKKLIKEGHDIGLHAIISESYWHFNRLYDVRPDGGSNFSALREEVRGSNVDGTGTNAFGDIITEDTLASEIYLNVTNIPEKSVKVVELTQEQVDHLNRQYCFYSDEKTHSGIDDLAVDIFKDAVAPALTKTKIQWLEYYYNALVGDTLGFSSISDTIAGRFSEDYDIPSGASASDYYPDAAHILNGKMVYYGDTGNAHYAEAKLSTASGFSDNDYQLVGKFKKGLYKDSFTTCNYEVMDRCITVAEAFFRKYFGLNHFSEVHIHGVQYLPWVYKDSDGYYYLDRGKNIIENGLGTFYSTRLGKFICTCDILHEFGADYMKESTRRFYAKNEGLVGYYYGQEGIRGTDRHFNNQAYDSNDSSLTALTYEYTSLLAAFGTSSGGQDAMSYDTFMTFMEGIDNWTKFFYENAGTNNITRNGVTMNVYDKMKAIMDIVVATNGTGKIPQISVDTIENSPAIMIAVELLFRFFKENGYDVVTLREARDRILADGVRNVNGNMFPNPGFEQTILRYLGGDSTNDDAYLPDGWKIMSSSNGTTYSVDRASDYNNAIALAVSGTCKIGTRAFALPAGNYKLSYSVIMTEGTSESATVYTRKVRNGDKFSSTGNVIDTYHATDSWTNHEVTFVIDDFHRNMPNATDYVNVVCDGFEDNVFAVDVRIRTNDATMKIANVKLYKI